MEINQIVEKYGIQKSELTNFTQDLSAHFAKSNEFKAKRSEIMILYDELEKRIKDMTETLSSKPAVSISKSELGEYASKAAKIYAEEEQIDPSTVTGTGQKGKITKNDLLKLTKKPKSKKVKVTKTEPKGCNGVKTSGDPCTNNGVYELENEWYCGFHKDQGKKVEEIVAYDSEEEYEIDEEVENCDNCENCENCDNCEIPVEKLEEPIVEPVEEPIEEPIVKAPKKVTKKIAKSSIIEEEAVPDKPKRKILKKKKVELE